MCRRRVSSLVALLFLSVAPGAYGQEDSEALVLSPEVLTILSELQEGWLDWLSSVNRDDESAASAALASLLPCDSFPAIHTPKGLTKTSAVSRIVRLPARNTCFI